MFTSLGRTGGVRQSRTLAACGQRLTCNRLLPKAMEPRPYALRRLVNHQHVWLRASTAHSRRYASQEQTTLRVSAKSGRQCLLRRLHSCRGPRGMVGFVLRSRLKGGQDRTGQTPTRDGPLADLHSMQRHQAARGVEPAPPQLLVPQACSGQQQIIRSRPVPGHAMTAVAKSLIFLQPPSLYRATDGRLSLAMSPLQADVVPGEDTGLTHRRR